MVRNGFCKDKSRFNGGRNSDLETLRTVLTKADGYLILRKRDSGP